MVKTLYKLSNLSNLVRNLSMKFNIGSFTDRMAIDAFVRTEYAYCTMQAAFQAKQLGINRISIIEFGVATGSGILRMEEYAKEIEKITNVKIDVYGFDTAEGMPDSLDYRDLPYIWEKGYFKMDYSKLLSKLTKAKLIIGNVKDTIDSFCEKYQPAPIGFISFDLDYYSSTVSALKIFNSSHSYFLPRTFCFFDDLIGNDLELHSEYSGELLAIKEFNSANSYKKIAQIYGLAHKRMKHSYWNDEVFVMHWFNHPLYSKHIYPDKNWLLDY
jgi:hypothetical protein